MIINMNGAKAPETPSPTLQEKTVTPETLPTVIGPDEGYDGLSQVTVNPDAQLKAENIRSGKTVFGVEGSFVGAESSSQLLSAIHHYLAGDGEYVEELNTSDFKDDIGWPDVTITSIMPMLRMGCSVKTLRVNDPNYTTIRVAGGHLVDGNRIIMTPARIICDTTNNGYSTSSSISGFISGLPEIPSGGNDSFLASKIDATIFASGDLTIDDTHWFNNTPYGGLNFAYLRVLENGEYVHPRMPVVFHFKRNVSEIGVYTFNLMSPYSVRFYADTPPKIYPDTFSIRLVNLIVPKGKLETYQNATGWGSYAGKIVEADE